MKSFFVRGLSAAGLCIAIATTALLVVDACGGSTDSGSSSGGTGTAADISNYSGEPKREGRA